MIEPPKPRFKTGRFGKASEVFQMRMLELPTKRIGCSGGGFLASAASNLAISASQIVESWAGLVAGRVACAPISAETKKLTKTIGRPRFIADKVLSRAPSVKFVMRVARDHDRRWSKRTP